MLITIKNDKITDIQINPETSISKTNLRYTNQALDGLRAAILSMDITDLNTDDDIDIDAVSTATCSSNAIKDCVKQALLDAKK